MAQKFLKVTLSRIKKEVSVYSVSINLEKHSVCFLSTLNCCKTDRMELREDEFVLV